VHCSPPARSTTTVGASPAVGLTDSSVLLQVPDVRAFMRHYNMDCPAAVNRLIVSGIPATIEHGNTGYAAMKKLRILT
jgi:hypothetical protein